MYEAHDVIATAKAMLALYRAGQYQALVRDYFEPDAVFILPDHTEPICGEENLIRYVFRAQTARAFSNSLASMRFEVSRGSNDVFVLYGYSGPALPPGCEKGPSALPHSISCGFRETENGLKLMIAHTSIPLSEQSLHRAAADVYGAVFLCAADERLSLLQMNESFLSMFGYAREEISARFSESFREMVLPEDRASLLPHPGPEAGVEETEFRIACKDGTQKWVLQRRQLLLDGAGTPYFCCILLDISSSKKLQLALSMSLARHEIILNQTNDIIFEWDIAAQSFSVTSNWEKMFHCIPGGGSPEALLAAIHVHREDRVAMLRFLRSILQGDAYVEGEARIAKSDGTFLWCRGRSTQQFDDKGAPVKAIGVISNIDEEKRRAQKLLEKAERDTLTGLYNKGTVQSLIAEHLADRSGSLDALLIIDLDNFKHVNDSAGHLFGDSLLAHIAACLSRIFRSTDLVGRIGGDEFIVFARNIPSVDMIRQKADQALKAFRVMPGNEKNRVGVSCSIGIALADRPEETFETLYANADWALYRAKHGGKNRYALYEGDDFTM